VRGRIALVVHNFVGLELAQGHRVAEVKAIGVRKDLEWEHVTERAGDREYLLRPHQYRT